MNNYHNKIGTVDIEKPALDNEIKSLENSLNAVQSILLLLCYLTVAWIVYKKVKQHKNRILKFILFFVFIAAFRMILFYAGLPSAYLSSSLTDASYFSSTFAYGIVRSPLEFSISAVLSLFVILLGFNYWVDFSKSKTNKNKNWFVFIIVSVLSSFFILLLLRGLGASLRSVVFDSTIRYFKEFNLIPDAPTFLMDFNILVVGFAIILLSLILEKILHFIFYTFYCASNLRMDF